MMRLTLYCLAACLPAFVTASSIADPTMSTPLIIAHRGASGYLPEHTLPAKALAHGQGADFLEQDLVLTKDDVPIVLHDIHLDTVTNVARLFPGRARGDGRYYALDFTLAEIRQLAVSERFEPKTGKAVYPGRFPAHQGRFEIPTFDEELEFIAGLNKSTGRVAGIYPEIKQPAFHRAAGKDISPIMLGVLSRRGYLDRDAPCYLQCFDAGELRRISNELGCQLKLIQLLDKEPWLPPDGTPAVLQAQLQEIARYAQGIGPNLATVFPPGADSSRSLLVEAAHAAGLAVHPWTYRADALPKNFATFADLHAATRQAGIDGLFSDFPDQSRRLLESAQR
jgi:glycerophosphoryl diester phosphodiesterase